MANPEHLKILKQGVEVWNKWRGENPEVLPDLDKADLAEMDLQGINLKDAVLMQADLLGANLAGANLQGACFRNSVMVGSILKGAFAHRASFEGADLRGAKFRHSDARDANFCNAKIENTNFTESDLRRAKFDNQNLVDATFRHSLLEGASFIDANISRAFFDNADLRGADLSGVVAESTRFFNAILDGASLGKANLKTSLLSGARFIGANLSNADLKMSSLDGATFVGTNLSNANIERANIYGISAWDIKKDGLIQKDLIITPKGEPEITVDDLEVAQFIYLMLNNQNIRNVIETITSKAVLILGRFTEERKKVLDALKDELRLRNYLPIVFDFDKPSRRDIDETVNLLARMSRFVVADVTDAKSIPQELKGFVEGNPSIPLVPLILKNQSEYAMFEHFRRYPWVLPLHEYTSPEELMTNIIPAIIAPAEQKVAELRRT